MFIVHTLKNNGFLTKQVTTVHLQKCHPILQYMFFLKLKQEDDLNGTESYGKMTSQEHYI